MQTSPFKAAGDNSSKVPAAIWALGFTSLFMDLSSELIHSLLPLFMTSTLGMGALAVGLIEGAAEGTALLIKAPAGALSDYMGKRKPLALAGYAMCAVCKPLFALATGPGAVFLARFTDRIGKGIRGAPRDALIADIAPPQVRGAAFGLRQALDTVGAVAGPLLAMALMAAWAGDIRSVFWVAVVPAAVSVTVLAVFVREPAAPAEKIAVNPFQLRQIGRLERGFWMVAAIGALFTMARFSEAFIILRASQTGLSTGHAPLALAVMNTVYAACAYPFGKLSDRVSHWLLLAAGFAVLIAADTALAFAATPPMALAGAALWGLHMGLTQGLLSAMVAQAAPENLRGTAFGLFYFTCGVAMLASSALAGYLWQAMGAEYSFTAGAGFCALGLAALSVAGNNRAPKSI